MNRIKSSITELHSAWLVVGMMLILLVGYLAVSHHLDNTTLLLRQLPESERIPLRTTFYAITIVIFPLTNLIRHVQLRLNQTMPIPDSSGNIAKQRYFRTILISMLLIHTVGVFGLLMFRWGDGYNTLYIFTGLSALGIFLYRPKLDEYQLVVDALAAKHDENAEQDS